ncbi:hypothetical protein ACJRO7_022734 [Eucalyptus globulus]|uniref:BZIP domain-containing protein n=1 Tax=Eucalyptus globulus TaxID=34317 RepID=A0ABD3K8Y7_EUCGL
MDDKSMPSAIKAHGTHFLPLGREESLSTLTFGDVHRQMGNLGKPFNGMTLNELTRVTPAEEGLQLQNPNSTPSVFLGNFDLNETQNKKPEEDVWGEIVDTEQVGSVNNQSLDPQMTLGETTLENFLVGAGVINLDVQENPINQEPTAAVDPMMVVSQPMDWVQLRMASVQQQQPLVVLNSNFNVSSSAYENQGFETGYAENQKSLPISAPAISATSPDSQGSSEKKYRYSDEVMDKTVERRQKRMIKNRESAARSRARKQAYTNHLEHQALRLRKTNNWLRKQKELELLFYSDSSSMPKYQLRRTSSSLF